MNKEIRKALSDEIHRRHGYRFMEAKIKPVHIANALMRVEHQCVGRMAVLEQLFHATLNRNPIGQRLEAAQTLIDSQRERWGRLGESDDLKSSPLMTKVLPLIRTLLGADGAVFGTSPEWSSFSSPTALTVTGDASDDGAGAFVHRLWSAGPEHSRLNILDLLNALTDPEKDSSQLDDLSALLVPLVDGTKKKVPPSVIAEDLSRSFSAVEISLRESASSLCKYEEKLRPNPIASLQRIVLLAALSVFIHASTRPRERAGLEPRVFLLDASGDAYSNIADASTRCVAQQISDARFYMAQVLQDMLDAADSNWENNPRAAINVLMESLGHAPVDENNSVVKRLNEIATDTDTDDLKNELSEEIVRSIEGSSGRGLDGYLRLLGVRSGFLYPQQKNPKKRLVPTDRTLEVLVATVIDVNSPPIEYREFLDLLRERWGIIVGGRLEDAELLSEVGAVVPTRELTTNSERFLTRLESIGLARRLADSVAVVGLLEDSYE
jgi:hypothetical protein